MVKEQDKNHIICRKQAVLGMTSEKQLLFCLGKKDKLFCSHGISKLLPYMRLFLKAQSYLPVSTLIKR